MPIRFRCEHCDQLLGIARRKAGTLVRCPNCQHDVQVPGESASPLPVAAPVAAPAPPVGLFDRDDFDVLLQGGAPPVTEGSRAPANGRGVAPPPPPMASVGGTMGLDRWAPAPSNASGAGGGGGASGSYPAPAGVVLSPLMATALTVAVILLVASAFGVGVLVGRAWGN